MGSMNIVVLDGFTLNPGDLDWNEIEALGNCKIYDRTPSEEVVARCKNAEIVITNKTPINEGTINLLPKLRYISVIATGYNIVDIEAAGKKGIPVSNIPTYGTKSVAQMTMALLLELTNQVGHHAQTVKEGRWTKSDDWCYWDRPLIELDGLNLGLIGFGRIGQAVGTIAAAFGMQIFTHDPVLPDPLPEHITFISLDQLIRESDVVTLHCPLTADNEQFINSDKLSMMKSTAFFINTSRGQLVNNQNLADALNNDVIAGAAIDVLDKEPPGKDNPLLKAKNCIVTPHISWATNAARKRLMHVAVENIKSYIQGTPQNVVNKTI
jgi:glycerate dehydrogenase